jgi:hypothetical protein
MTGEGVIARSPAIVRSRWSEYHEYGTEPNPLTPNPLPLGEGVKVSNCFTHQFLKIHYIQLFCNKVPGRSKLN